MSRFVIPREDVHSLAEACSDDQARFAAVAPRLIKEQKRLSRWVKREVPTIAGQEGHVALYLYSVIIRVFQAYGGKLGRVDGAGIAAAQGSVQGLVSGLLPFDEGFPERVRGVDGRAQPHILDEALWALFERDELREDEVEVDNQKSGLIFMVLWVVTEALDAVWTPPKG